MSTVTQEAIAPIAPEALVGDRAHASRAPIDMPRGWLMRRLLVGADVTGLMSAFLLALAVGPATPIADRVNVSWEIALFVASLPLWVFLARAHSLYDRDGEPCHDCGATIRRIVLVGRSSFYCPRCQR